MLMSFCICMFPTKSELVFARKKSNEWQKLAQNRRTTLYTLVRALFLRKIFLCAQSPQSIYAAMLLRWYCAHYKNQGKNCQNLRKISTFWRFYVEFAPIISFFSTYISHNDANFFRVKLPQSSSLGNYYILVEKAKKGFCCFQLLNSWQKQK